jgi:hypothetical protein
MAWRCAGCGACPTRGKGFESDKKIPAAAGIFFGAYQRRRNKGSAVSVAAW